LDFKKICEELVSFQIYKATHDLDSAKLTIETIHCSGKYCQDFNFVGVRHFELDMPPFKVESPYLVFDSTFKKLVNFGVDFLREVKYSHTKNGDVYVNPDEELFYVHLCGDIVIKVVFSGFEVSERY
jgi:hypothetical protein